MSETVRIRGLRRGSAERNCGDCTFWSAWMPNTGDCMRYAQKRREAMVAREEVPPAMSAKCTARYDVCDDFTSREPAA